MELNYGPVSTQLLNICVVCIVITTFIDLWKGNILVCQVEQLIV